MITRKTLLDIKREALRFGVWYKALERVERSILSLTARLLDRVKSSVLGIELIKIVNKLKEALEGGVVRRKGELGFARAKEIASLAISWGYKAAIGWASDLNFVRYLTFLNLNAPLGWVS